MEVNYLIILACGVLAMVVGAIWYGPLLFGHVWMRINHMRAPAPEDMARMQKAMIPTYLLQFALALTQVYILAHFVKGWTDVSGIEAALWIWLGFVVPTLGASVLWTEENTQDKMTRFAVQAGYNFVLFIAFGYILSVWG
jgi:hypothetical protein